MIEELNEAYGKLIEKLTGWVDAVVLHLPNLLIAILIVVVAWLVAKQAYRLVHSVVMRAGGNHNVADLLGSVMRVVVVTLGLFIGLSVMNLSQAVTSMLAGAGIVGLAVGFALQDPLANLFSGVMMSVKELYGKGDLVETNGYFGKIQRITLRTTIIKTLQGQEVVIPNKEVLQNPLVNYSVTGSRRLDLSFGVSYGDDLRLVRDTVKRTVEDKLEIDARLEVQVFFTEFGDSSINGVVRMWLTGTGQADYLAVQSEAIIAVKEAFDEADIMIPFPIRTLDFGIKGGESLSEIRLRTGDPAPGTE